MFKVKKSEYVNKTFRLPIELVQKLEILAQNKNVSLNNLVIQCCEYALENIDDSDNNSLSGRIFCSCFFDFVRFKRIFDLNIEKI